MRNNIRSYVENGVKCRMVYDLTYEDDIVFGPSLLLRLDEIYTGFLQMNGPTLNRFCAEIVDQSLAAQLPRFEVSRDYFGFDGVFASDPPVITDYLEYRAVLGQANPRRSINRGLYLPSIAATLSVLFNKGEFFSAKKTNKDLEQLFYCISGTKKGGGGYFLAPVLSRTASRFVTANSERLEQVVLKAMMKTWSVQHGENAERSHGFRAEFIGGQFVLYVPGTSATSLRLSNYDDRCWRLTSHNIDNASDQLQLLAGLAAILAAIRDDEIEKKRI